MRAIVLAGGKGERLRPLTDKRPKAMVEIAGAPLLSYNINWLRFNGCDKITIACGYLSEVIQDYFGDGTKYGVQISYQIEAEALGRGGALKNALQSTAHDEPVLALNGDILTTLNVSELLEYHKTKKPLATIVAAPFKSQYGIIEHREDGLVSGFLEKPELPYWINAGIYIFEPQIVNYLPDRGDHEEMTFPLLAQRGMLQSFCSRAFWHSVDSVKDLYALESNLAGNFAPEEHQRLCFKVACKPQHLDVSVLEAANTNLRIPL